MKKTGVFLFLLLTLSLVSLTLATEGDNCTITADCDAGELCQDNLCTVDDSDSTPTTSQQDPDKIPTGYDCLEEKASDCSGLTTQEIAYTILATPDNIFDKCVKVLEDQMEDDNWGNVRDTALAILALDHAGKDTEASELWLLDQARTPTELIWYLQQDSNEAVECHIGYQTNDYTINIGTNKKIASDDIGTCLTRANSNFWLEINNNCYDEEFNIECDKQFIATLLYKNRNSPTIYPIEGTESAPAYGSIKLKVNSKCFGTTSCEYEATAWATLALLKKGYNVEEFIPYVIAMAESNEQYLPDSFIYMLTNYEDYASQLIADQKLGNYWEAPSSAYNRYYDTALALIALGSSSSEKITKARDWLLFKQGANGCWQNSIRDTAIVLWALEGRSGKTSSGGGVTYCSEAGYFCIPSNDCPSDQDVGNNFFCASLSDTCCMIENLKSCSDYNGEECDSGYICSGNERKATDTDDCCTGTCVVRSETTECEESFYYCKDSCSASQESVDYVCDGGQVCCRTKTEPTKEGSTWWIWVLIILIIAVLGAIAWVKREALRLWWFKIRSKFKKDKGRKGGAAPQGPRPGMPPRPGFPPVRRKPMRRAPPQRRPSRRDTHMDSTFRKLKEMSR